jgi:hypothetical protein
LQEWWAIWRGAGYPHFENREVWGSLWVDECLVKVRGLGASYHCGESAWTKYPVQGIPRMVCFGTVRSRRAVSMDCKTSAAEAVLGGGDAAVPRPPGFLGTGLVRLVELVRQRLLRVALAEFNTTCTACNDEIAVHFGDRPLSAGAWAKRSAADYEGAPRRCSGCGARMGSAA